MNVFRSVDNSEEKENIILLKRLITFHFLEQNENLDYFTFNFITY